MLLLNRASKSRPSGQWSDDDYDVFDGDLHIGRIMWTQAAPEDRRWFWTITARDPQSTHDQEPRSRTVKWAAQTGQICKKVRQFNDRLASQTDDTQFMTLCPQRFTEA